MKNAHARKKKVEEAIYLLFSFVDLIPVFDHPLQDSNGFFALPFSQVDKPEVSLDPIDNGPCLRRVQFLARSAFLTQSGKTSRPCDRQLLLTL